MRGKRSKQYRKLMQQYGLTFGFREPYQVLLSSKIIQDAGRCKMRLGAMLENTLHGGIKPMITQCCIRHLYNTTDHSSQAEKDEWIAVAKQAERRRCGHHELTEPLSELECMKSVVDSKDSGTNKHRYVIATQDAEVRKYMRSKVAGVPLIYVARSVMILEPMGGKTEEVKEQEERSKYRAGIKSRRGDAGAAIGEKRKRDDGENDNEAKDGKEVPKKRKIKGPKGPNPLSVKKAKKPAEKKQENGHERAGKNESNGKKTEANRDAASTAAAIATGNGEGEAAKKRKRKRKHKDAAAATANGSATTAADGEGDGDAGEDDLD